MRSIRMGAVLTGRFGGRATPQGGLSCPYGAIYLLLAPTPAELVQAWNVGTGVLDGPLRSSQPNGYRAVCRQHTKWAQFASELRPYFTVLFAAYGRICIGPHLRAVHCRSRGRPICLRSFAPDGARPRAFENSTKDEAQNSQQRIR